MKNKIISIIGNIMFYILIITILVLAFLFANNKSPDKSIFGYRLYNVMTPSMEPTIPVGSAVFVKMIEPDELKTGDIITYSTSKDGSVVVTHRINEVVKGENYLKFITKGDANNVTDLNPVLSSSVIGKVNLIIPYLGNILIYIKENIFLVIAGIVGLIVIFEFVLKMIKSMKK